MCSRQVALAAVLLLAGAIMLAWPWAALAQDQFDPPDVTGRPVDVALEEIAAWNQEFWDGTAAVVEDREAVPAGADPDSVTVIGQRLEPGDLAPTVVLVLGGEEPDQGGGAIDEDGGAVDEDGGLDPAVVVTVLVVAIIGAAGLTRLMRRPPRTEQPREEERRDDQPRVPSIRAQGHPDLAPDIRIEEVRR